MGSLSYLSEVLEQKPIVAIDEIAAYEYLWSLPKSTVKTMADLFKKNPYLLPSEIVGSDRDLNETKHKLLNHLADCGVEDFGLFINGTIDYPVGLLDAKNPIEMLYYRGDWGLLSSEKLIAIVGARKVSEEGTRRTRKLVKHLVDHDYTIVSGLAEGVDTAAHEAAIEFGGKTIAVIGTPITEVYPKSNIQLCNEIVNNHLLVSQVPVLRYSSQDWRTNRGFFPERNKTMSALTKASVIVEASETSGTLIQARAAFYQNRELFILASCFENSAITWPQRFANKGAHRVDNIENIISVLGS
jgi:DNA processing protein